MTIASLSNHEFEISQNNTSSGWGSCGACGNQPISGFNFTVSDEMTFHIGLNQLACSVSNWRMDHHILLDSLHGILQVCACEVEICHSCRSYAVTDTFGIEVRDK
eukprot:scaffold64308_cov64-Attheya_sp.AAC.1